MSRSNFISVQASYLDSPEEPVPPLLGENTKVGPPECFLDLFVKNLHDTS